MRAAVLVVEDNPVTRRLLHATLSLEGCQVFEAASGREALDWLGTHRADVIVQDLVLPDMDGEALLAEIRGRPGGASLPVLVLSGLLARLEDLEAQRDPLVRCLAKPAEPTRVVEAVASLLAARAPGGGPEQPRVLVVADDPAVRRGLDAVLRRSGFAVTGASGSAALEEARRVRPAAVVSEAVLADRDGFELGRALRSEPALAAAPLLLLAPHEVGEEDRRLGEASGVDGVVARTAGLAELVDAVRAALAEGGRPREPAPEPEFERLRRAWLFAEVHHNARKSEEAVRREALQAAAMSFLAAMSAGLTRSKDVTHVLGDVLVHCLDAAGLSTGFLYLADGEGRITLRTATGLGKALRADAETLFGHDELLRAVLARGVPLALVAGTDAGVGGEEVLERLAQRSVLLVPFVVGGEALGVLVLASNTEDLWARGWLSFGRTLALQFGQSVALAQSLARLAVSEERYRSLFEGVPVGVYRSTPGGEVLEANGVFARMLGLEHAGAARGLDLRDLHVDAGRRDEWMRRLEDEGFVRDFEVRLRRADGRDVWVRKTAEARRDPEGRVVYYEATLSDVTERREAERRIEEILSASPAVVYTLALREDGAPACTWLSDNVEGLLGFRAEEALVPGWWDARVHPEDREALFADRAAALVQGHAVWEYRVLHADGRYRWIRDEVVARPRGENGAVLAVGSWSDITARREAEARLRESEEQYRILFDENPQPMWVFDGETLAFQAVNEAAVRHYGYSRDEFLAMTLRDVHPEAEAARLEALREAVLRAPVPGEARLEGSWVHRTREGRLLDVEVSGSPIGFRGGAAWLALASDVTEKRVLQAQLLQAQKLESIGRLAGGVAHDFNNVLGVIEGYSELLLKRLPPDDALRRYPEQIGKAAARAAGLTQQLLAFSRRQILQPKLLDLHHVVRELDRMLRRLIGEDVDLRLDLSPGPLTVHADPTQLEQVILNLAVNARDAMPRGGRLTIATAAVDLGEREVSGSERPGPYVRLAVADTGVGMPAEVRARLFEPFFTTKEEGKGTGLGLATVHGIVEQSGGFLRVESEPGHGTAFRVFLPRHEGGGVPPDDAPRPPSLLPRGSETLLVAEDEAMLRSILRECLEDGGYVVLEAGDGPEALRVAEGHPGSIDLLVTDVVMPGMSGRELAERLRASRPGLRVLFLSGYTDDAVVRHGVSSDEEAFLQKPFSVEDLAHRVREVLDAPPGPPGSSGR